MQVTNRPRVSTATLIELEYWALRWLKRRPGSFGEFKKALRAFLDEMSATRR